MQKLNILGSREIKKVNESLVKNFGFSLSREYVYLMNENERLFLVNKDFSELNLRNLIIDKLGLYFAEFKNKEIRLTKEGTQLLALEAKKSGKKLQNVLELSKEEVKYYFQGNDLEKDLGEEKKFILLKYKENFLGCARYKEKKIINFLPKIHRGEVIL